MTATFAVPRNSGLVDEVALVTNMLSCLNASPSYKLNSLVYATHTRNFRAELVGEMLGNVGISGALRSIRADQQYAASVDALDSGGPISFTRFDDLVERRNEVSHGSQASSLLSLEYLRGYLRMVWAFTGALHARVRGEALSHLAAHHGRDLGKPIKTYKDGTVAALDLQAGLLRVDDLLISRAPDLSCEGGCIVSLQVADKDLALVDATDSPQPVGIQLPFAVKSSHELVVLARTDAIAARWAEHLGC